jgi:hypothetical protein
MTGTPWLLSNAPELPDGLTEAPRALTGTLDSLTPSKQIRWAGADVPRAR